MKKKFTQEEAKKIGEEIGVDFLKRLLHPFRKNGKRSRGGVVIDTERQQEQDRN